MGNRGWRIRGRNRLIARRQIRYLGQDGDGEPPYHRYGRKGRNRNDDSGGTPGRRRRKRENGVRNRYAKLYHGDFLMGLLHGELFGGETGYRRRLRSVWRRLSHVVARRNGDFIHLLILFVQRRHRLFGESGLFEYPITAGHYGGLAAMDACWKIQISFDTRTVFYRMPPLRTLLLAGVT